MDGHEKGAAPAPFTCLVAAIASGANLGRLGRPHWIAQERGNVVGEADGTLALAARLLPAGLLMALLHLARLEMRPRRFGLTYLPGLPMLTRLPLAAGFRHRTLAALLPLWAVAALRARGTVRPLRGIGWLVTRMLHMRLGRAFAVGLDRTRLARYPLGPWRTVRALAARLPLALASETALATLASSAAIAAR